MIKKLQGKKVAEEVGTLYKRLTQTQLIVVGYVLVILIGTVLLMLPVSSRSGSVTSFLDALFTATSATCVTGLIVADTFQHWSTFGQSVVLLLIQIGGLGFMTIGVFFAIFLRRRIGLKIRGILQESVNSLQIGGIVRLTKKIIVGTLIFEGAGAALLAIRFVPQFGPGTGLYYAVFHSVSAFCNGGFDLMGRKEAYSSLTAYYNDGLVNLTIMALIIIGGIGFFVWNDLWEHKWHWKKYRLHTKIVLSSTGILIVAGAVLFYIFEAGNVLKDMPVWDRIWCSLFNSVTARTAGFNTTDTGALRESSQLLTILLMLIGGSPGSTAGGMKTTTLVVLILYVKMNLRQQAECNIFGRRLGEDAIRKASVVFCTNLFLVIAVTLAIAGLENLPMMEIMFEVSSAMGTAGMSTGITRELGAISRILLIFLMYCGRIGSLTFALSFRGHKYSPPVLSPTEQIIIG